MTFCVRNLKVFLYQNVPNDVDGRFSLLAASVAETGMVVGSIGGGPTVGASAIPIEHERRRTIPITWALLVMTSYVISGGLLFAHWENWTVLDGCYFCYISLSTIGFGDLVSRQTRSVSELHLVVDVPFGIRINLQGQFGYFTYHSIFIPIHFLPNIGNEKAIQLLRSKYSKAVSVTNISANKIIDYHRISVTKCLHWLSGTWAHRWWRGRCITAGRLETNHLHHILACRDGLGCHVLQPHAGRGHRKP